MEKLRRPPTLSFFHNGALHRDEVCLGILRILAGVSRGIWCIYSRRRGGRGRRRARYAGGTLLSRRRVVFTPFFRCCFCCFFEFNSRNRRGGAPLLPSGERKTEASSGSRKICANYANVSFSSVSSLRSEAMPFLAARNFCRELAFWFLVLFLFFVSLLGKELNRGNARYLSPVPRYARKCSQQL